MNTPKSQNPEGNGVAWPASRVNIADPHTADGARIVGFRILPGDPWYGDYGLSEPLFALIDAVTAPTLTALQSENARLKVENRIKTRAVDRWVPCPDHRDKTDDQGCYVCRNETLTRKYDDMQRRLEAVTELYGRLCGQVDDSKADFGWKIIRSYRDELRGILFDDEPPVLRGDGKGE